jgi:hypothetical protein
MFFFARVAITKSSQADLGPAGRVVAQWPEEQVIKKSEEPVWRREGALLRAE